MLFVLHGGALYTIYIRVYRGTGLHCASGSAAEEFFTRWRSFSIGMERLWAIAACDTLWPSFQSPYPKEVLRIVIEMAVSFSMLGERTTAHISSTRSQNFDCVVFISKSGYTPCVLHFHLRYLRQFSSVTQRCNSNVRDLRTR